ncbi:unnamed protein product [Orchesella dallaii]|uniref:G-protein coupled receptors family 1 profile domain-containing protein n=1 Tax=Orchesella dallaii TaxID=48710 RepID=A0ABP1QGH7_9HEXA
MNASSDPSVVLLSFFMCHMMDLQPRTKDCAVGNISVCIICGSGWKFFTGEKIDDFYSVGHLICLLLGITTIFIAMIGVFTNCIIVEVFRRQGLNRPFDFLLMVLAYVDLCVCGMCILATIAALAIYQNVNRELATICYWYLCLPILLGKSGSTAMTLLISIERFLAIKYPFRAKQWFTSFNTKSFAVLLLTAAVVSKFPKFFVIRREPNIYRNGGLLIPSIQDFQYILTITEFALSVDPYLWDIHTSLEYLLPLPAMLVLNTLSYIQVQKMLKERKDVNCSQITEINALDLFLPVVVVLIVSNLAPLVHFAFLYYLKTLYREMNTAMLLSIVLNSAVNFHIYHYKGLKFKQDAKAILRSWFKLCS